MIKKYGLQKTLALLLIIATLFNVIPMAALADVRTTIHNTPQHNEAILEVLRELYGDELAAQFALEEMARLGLFDGEEWVTSTVDVDGEQLTLEEVRALVYSAGANLAQLLTVNGKLIPLGDLRIMIEIEDEIERIRSTYFSDVTLTGAQQQALASLRHQIESQGITVKSADVLEFPSGVDHGIYAEISTASMVVNNETGGHTVTVTLKDSSGNQLAVVPDYDISMSYRLVDGSAKMGTNYGGINGTLTFAANSLETSKWVSVNVLWDHRYFEGQKTFLVQYFNPHNVLFAGGKRAAETVVTIQNSYLWNVVGEAMSFSDTWGGPTYRTVSKPQNWYHMFEEGLIDRVELTLDGSGAFRDPSPSPVVYLGTLPSEGEDPEGASGVFKYQFSQLGDWKWIYTKQQLFYQPGTAEKMREGVGGWNFALDLDQLVSLDVTFRFIDSISPAVSSVTMPDSLHFEYGQSVPIVVEYSEPVNLSNAKLVVNGETLSAVESTSNGTRHATFLYPVKQVDGTSLHVTDVHGVVDLHSNTQSAYSLGTRTATGIIKGIQKADAFTAATASATLHQNKQEMAGTVTLALAETLPEWLTSEAGAHDFLVPSIYASIDGGLTRIDLYANGENATSLVGSFTDVLNTTPDPVNRVVEFYLDPEMNSSSNHALVLGQYAAYTVAPVVFLEEGDFTITYQNFPTGEPIFAEDGLVPKLGIALRVSVEATWLDPLADFVWSSNNPAVATIGANGTISLTGTPGVVSFALTAKNGGVADKAVAIQSDSLDVRVGLTPFLRIPAGGNVAVIRQGDGAEVRWTSNLIAKNAEAGEDTEFTVEVFLADYSTGSLQKGASVYSHSISGDSQHPVSSYIIPAENLIQVSVIGRYSYVVEVISINPIDDSVLSATAFISVFSRPAVVRLGKLSNYYITDATSTVPVTWTLQYFDMLNDAQFELEIKNNKDGTTLFKQTDTANQGGSYQLDIPPVTNGFKDIYTVTVKAKNSTDSTWSYDSFVLNVYSHASLSIWVDGAVAGSEHTMSNVSRVSTMSSAEILDLQRDIHLKNVISINFGDHAWGQISDQIKWRSSDSVVASVNYRQGSLYENIENFTYISYRPTTEFVLSGLRDGSTQVVATHAATNMTKTLTVQVETLKDKLYLFQLYPQALTALTYTNGNGEKRTVETNEQGALALFEESSIDSDIYLQSVFNEREYRGTIYRNRLVSSEKDSTKLELYPENNFKLREAATVELYFKQPNGEPYEGQVILRGGVYKNGDYCSEALLNLKSGETDQTIDVGANGKFTVKMDASQFWVGSDLEVLQPQDQLQFIYEVRFPDDVFYPHLISLDGNLNVYETVRFGLSTVNLREVQAEDLQKPFIDAQHIELNANIPNAEVRTFAGKIGLGQNVDQVSLITRVLWWGEASLDHQGLHNLIFEDQFGIVPQGQNSQMIIYPFSSLKNSFHTFIMDRSTMEIWLQPGESRAMNLIVIDGEGSQYRKIPMPFRIVNMLDADRVEVSNNLSFLLETLTKVSSANAKDIRISDTLINAGLKVLSGQDIDSQLFSMLVRPTADPTVFRALIRCGVGNMAYEDTELSFTPGPTSVQQMANGNYLVKQKEKLNHNKSHTKSLRAREMHYAFGGYMEADIVYNEFREEWEIVILNGGFNAGGGVSYFWNYNTWVGPVPVTGQLKVGATVEVIFKVAVQRGEEIKLTYNEDAVNDYLTTLRLYAYFRAFAGFGVDYTVLALKIGLFGKISLDAQFAFLNQPYISSTAVKGQRFDVTGRVGIEFVASALFVSYTKILASKKFSIYGGAYGSWHSIQHTWKKIGKGSSGLTDLSLDQASALTMPDGTALYPVAEQAIIQERDYLEHFDRTWAVPILGMMALDPNNKVEHLETNSYPYSNPLLTDDGQLLVYISDADSSSVEDTEVRFTILSAGIYPNGVAINPGGGGYGDSQLKLAGTKDFAAAVWVRQSEALTKEAGETVTSTDVALMTNSTEVVASIYDGGTWTTTQLTSNSSPDLAPVVATNGSRVLVAWRSVYAADAAVPFDFSGTDNILYRIYENGLWSEAKNLYNGTSGIVKGLNAAMLADGTAAVTYAIDTLGGDFVLGDNSDEGVQSGMEIVYALVDMGGAVAKNVRLTNDNYLDQNPQITTVNDPETGEWFVLGWHSLHDADGISVNDIRLRAFNREGSLHTNFIDSISSVNDAGNVHISANFRFARNASTIDDLSILWVESADTGDMDEDSEEADKDVLKAVKFRNDNGRIYITAALDVATMPNYTLIDHFDAYTTGDDGVKAVILGTNYDNGFELTGLTFMENGLPTALALPIRQSNLYTATATYENRVELSLLAVDYESVIRGMRIPVQFRLHNAGTQPINSVSIKLGETTAVFPGLHFLPNDSIMFTAYYDIPADRVVNPEYTITATFADTHTLTGTLYLTIPDVGISRLESLREENGKRVMQVTLYNNSDVQLSETNRVVRLGFYSDVDYTEEVMPVQTVDSAADLALLDVGAFTRQFTFDIKEYVGEGNEIPVGGVRLYARAWIEEPLPDGPGEMGEILEYYLGNNFKSIVFESLVHRNDGDLATITTEQINESNTTRAIITVKNNSLVQVSSGNLIVSLTDSNGVLLETLQSYNPVAANQGLLELGAEATSRNIFDFSHLGATVSVSYSNAVLLDETNTKLASLTLSQIPLRFEAGVNEYTVSVKNMTSTTVTVVAEDPNATVSINNTGLSTAKLALASGTNAFEIKVTAADSTTIGVYKITIHNSHPSTEPPPEHIFWQPTVVHNVGGTVTVSTDGRHVTLKLEQGYRVKDLLVNGQSVGSATTYSVPAGFIAHRIEAIFERILLTVGHDAGGTVTVSEDGLTITITPERGYRIEDVLIDGESVGAVSSYSFASLITARIVQVTFAQESDAADDVKPGEVTIQQNTGGSVVLSEEGNCVVITLDQGYLVRNVLINGVSLGPITLYCAEPGTDLAIEVVFVEINEVLSHLTDVGNHWARDDIAFVVNQGLLVGTSITRFSPEQPISRAMLVTVLARLDGGKPQGPAQFVDVQADAWYAETVAWAAEIGIASDVGNGNFAPDQPSTREELAVILHSYFQYAGIKLPTAAVVPFADEASITPGAREAVYAIRQAGLMVGKGGNLFDPQGTLTRAEFAAVLQRFLTR